MIPSSLRRVSVLSAMRSWPLALAATLAVGCSAAAPPDAPRPTEPEKTSVESAATSGPVTRSQAIANAMEWVTAKLQYCQSANGQPDGDTACSSVCMRQSNAQWDPYRSDCSGFISWAWELPAPGLVTGTFAPYDTSASTVIQCADMKPGDAANRDPNSGHIVLFEKWVTPGTKAVFMEEPGCSSSTPYAHEFTSDVTCSGSSANIAYEGDTFTAIRYIHIVDDPADAGTGSSSGSSGGSSSGSSGSSSGTGSSSGSSGSSSGGHGGSSSGSSSGAGSSSSSGSSSGSSSSSSGSVGSSGAGSSSGATGSSSGGAAEPDASTGNGFNDMSGSGAGCSVSAGVSTGGRDTWGAAGLLALGLVVSRRRRTTKSR